jgi:hypothetical protein
MIVITKGEEKNIYFTGTENCLLVNPYFLFVFTNRTTNEEYKFIVTNQSTSDRYDYFSFNGEDLEEYDEGFWTYDIYEQATNTGTSIAGKHKVETGLMYLHPADSYEPIKYDEQSEQFKAYNG